MYGATVKTNLAPSWEVHIHTWVLLLKTFTLSVCVCVCVYVRTCTYELRFDACEFRHARARTSMWQPEDQWSQFSPPAMWALELNPGGLSWQQVPLLARPSYRLLFLFPFLLFFLFLFLLLFLSLPFLRHAHSLMEPRLTWGLLCSGGWPWVLASPTSFSLALGLWGSFHYAHG